ALGGALNLVTSVGKPPSGKRLTVSAGGGSFGARHLRARWRDGSDDGTGSHLSLGYAGATGDFSYCNDKGTNQDTADVGFHFRPTDVYEQVGGVAGGRGRSGGPPYELGSRTTWKGQGLPGGATNQATSASLSTVGQLIDGSVSRQGLWGTP